MLINHSGNFKRIIDMKLNLFRLKYQSKKINFFIKNKTIKTGNLN